jgi:hypothetical protein
LRLLIAALAVGGITAWLARRPKAPVPEPSPPPPLPGTGESPDVPVRLGRWVVAAIVTAAAIGGLLAGGVSLLGDATTQPLAPITDGGLYLFVNKPGVRAAISISVTSSREADPGFVASISLSSASAEFALVSQGAWKISDLAQGPLTTGSLTEHAGGIEAVPSNFAPSYTAPSSVIVGSTDGIGDTEVTGQLHGRITSIGDGQTVGYLPGISAQSVIGTVKLAGVPGRWQDPKSASIAVNVSGEFGNETVVSASPPTSAPGTLTWSRTDYIVPMSWDTTDPIDQANEQNAVLFIGILFGVWGALVVAVAQFLLRSWLHGRIDL